MFHKQDIELPLRQSNVDVDFSDQSSYKDDTQPTAMTRFDLVRKWLLRYCPLFLVATCLACAYSYIFGLIGQERSYSDDSSQCLDPNNQLFTTEEDPSIIGDIYFKHCECVPDWMDGGVYFEPAATLYLAVLVVVGFLFYNRVRPLMLLSVKSVFGSLFSLSMNSVKIAVDQFHTLPPMIQQWIQLELKTSFPTMPAIGSRPQKKQHFFESESFKVWKAATLKIEPFLQDHMPAEFIDQLEAFMKSSTNPNHANDDSYILDEGSSKYCKVNASPEFLDWLEKIGESERGKVIAICALGARKQHDTDDANDTLVLLFLQLLLGIGVIIDYFLVQTWPSGGDWQCRWVYFASIVMYKPFTVPMWSLLVTSCHYCFAEYLYGGIDLLRDKKTGTVFGSPLPRNYVTLCIISIVFCFQFVWFMGVVPVLIPLLAVFLPVVALPSFFLPLIAIGFTEYVVFRLVHVLKTMFKEFVLESVENDGTYVRSVWPWFRKDKDILRAAATQDRREYDLYSIEEQLYVACESFYPILDAHTSAEKASHKRWVIVALQHHGVSLEFASDDLKLDKEVVMTAVTSDGQALKFSADVFKDDKQVVMAAVEQCGDALVHASDRLKMDRDILRAALSQNGMVLEHVPNSMKEDEEIVMTAVRQRGGALRFASESLKDNMDIVMAAVTQNGWSVGQASNRLRGDKHILMVALESDGEALTFASDALKADKELVMKAVKQFGQGIQYASETLRADREVVLLAINESPFAIAQGVSVELRADKELVLIAVQKYGSVLEFASDELKLDKEVVMTAVTSDGQALKFSADVFKDDKQVVMAAVEQCGNALVHASDRLKADIDIVSTAVKQHGKSLEFASDTLKANRDIVMLAVQQDGSALEFASESLQLDVDMIATSKASISREHTKELDHSNQQLTEIKPPPFGETVFALKASATQLISVLVLAFLLLPLYDEGFTFWDDGANEFIFTNFNVPHLALQFSVSFSWPKFEQPGIQVQFIIGIILALFQYLIKFGKWFLWSYTTSILIPNKHPGYWEQLMMRAFSSVTWQVFRLPMELMQLSCIRLLKEMEQKAQMEDYKGLAHMIMFSLPLLLFYSYQYPLVKTMDKSSGDNEIAAFCKTEGSMAVRCIELIGDRTTQHAVGIVLKTCPWMKITKLNISSSVSTPLNVLCETLKPIEHSLQALDLSYCDKIKGRLSCLNKFQSLKVLRVMFSDISFDQELVENFLLEAIFSYDRKNINTVTNEQGVNVLMWAASLNYAPVVQDLILHAVELNKHANDGSTALMKAASAGSYQPIKDLIKAGAALDLQADTGHTALTLSILHAFVNGEAAALELIEAGAALDIQTREGTTALMLAGKYHLLKVFRALIAGGAQLDIQDENGWTALMIAYEAGCIEPTYELIDSGAALDIQNKDGKTILDLALFRENQAVIEKLQDAKLKRSERVNGTGDSKPLQKKPQAKPQKK